MPIQIAGPLVFDEASQLGQSGPFGDLRLAVSDNGVSGRTVEYEVFVQNKDGEVLFQHAGKNPIVHHSGEWVVFSNTFDKGIYAPNFSRPTFSEPVHPQNMNWKCQMVWRSYHSRMHTQASQVMVPQCLRTLTLMGNWRNVSWDIETREFNGDGSLNGGYASTTTSGDGRFEIKFGSQFGNVDSNSYVELSKVPFDAASLAIQKNYIDLTNGEESNQGIFLIVEDNSLDKTFILDALQEIFLVISFGLKRPL